MAKEDLACGDSLHVIGTVSHKDGADVCACVADCGMLLRDCSGPSVIIGGCICPQLACGFDLGEQRTWP
jgi:hypothetical protein